ncbi:MAG: GNAT family N-acetyltransferase [Rhodocyclaceae bacterium]|nr:GNAT family N-acetyltransferase [Rhodocyclaceae bacterium]
MKFTFAPASVNDLPDLIQLLDTLFSIEQDFTPQPEKQRRGLERLLADGTRACIMVARDESGHAIAMASAQLVISTAEGAPSAWIEDVVVSAAYRGRGLGKQVLAALLDWARCQGATRAQLLADLDNSPALDFYNHLGWQGTRLGARRIAL